MLSLSPSNASVSLSKMNHPPIAGPKFGEAPPVKLSKEVMDACDIMTQQVLDAVKPNLPAFVKAKKDFEDVQKKFVEYLEQTMKTLSLQSSTAIKPEVLSKDYSKDELLQMAEYTRQSVKEKLNAAVNKEMAKAPPKAKL